MAEVVLTINPTPAESTVVLTATGYTQTDNSISVEEGTTVHYSVSKNGYTTKEEDVVVNETSTIQVILAQNQDIRHKQVIKTSQQWAESDLVLLSGELGYASDTKIIKVGNGEDVWEDLPNLNNEFSYDAVNKRLILS